MSQFQITTIVSAMVIGVLLPESIGQISDEERRLREEFLRLQEQKPRVTRTRPSDSKAPSAPSSAPAGQSRYGYQGTTPSKPVKAVPRTTSRTAPRPATPAKRSTPPPRIKVPQQTAPPASRPATRPATPTKRYNPPASAPPRQPSTNDLRPATSSRTPSPTTRPPSTPRPSSPAPSRTQTAPSYESQPSREPDTPIRDGLRNFAQRLRNLPKTEQAGGGVEPAERMMPPPPKPAPAPAKSSSKNLAITTRKAGPPSPKIETRSHGIPNKPTKAAVKEVTNYVKSKAPEKEDLLDEFAKPLRISPPNLGDLSMPSGPGETAAAARIAAHEEKIESMLPNFSSGDFESPEVDLTYRQAPPLGRATANLFDFAVKHFVRIPGHQMVSTTLEKKDPEAEAKEAPKSEEPPPPVHDDGGTDPLNGFTITSLHQTDFNLEDSKMIFSGEVFCESPDFRLSCDEFVVHLRKDMKGMSYGEASGNVVITTVKDGKSTGHTGYARHAIYRPDQDNLMLSGWPRIRYNGKEHVAANAETQMILGTDGAVKTLGRSKTRFVN